MLENRLGKNMENDMDIALIQILFAQKPKLSSLFWVFAPNSRGRITGTRNGTIQP